MIMNANVLYKIDYNTVDYTSSTALWITQFKESRILLSKFIMQNNMF